MDVKNYVQRGIIETTPEYLTGWLKKQIVTDDRVEILTGGDAYKIKDDHLFLYMVRTKGDKKQHIGNVAFSMAPISDKEVLLTGWVEMTLVAEISTVGNILAHLWRRLQKTFKHRPVITNEVAALEQEINFKKLDEFREKQSYPQLLCEYQALLTLQDYLPAPASIRKEIRNIGICFGWKPIEHPNEDTIKFEFQHNGQPCFIDASDTPGFGAAVQCPPRQWQHEHKYTLVKVRGKHKETRTHAAKIALAALSQAVMAERDTWCGDVVNKLTDDAMWIFKEFNETPAAVGQAEPETPEAELAAHRAAVTWKGAPTTDKGREKWEKVAVIIREMERQYQQDFLDKKTEIKDVTDADILARLANEGIKRVGQSTLTGIKKAMRERLI